MSETPSYCHNPVCGHRYLIHNWRHPVFIAGRCLVAGCACPLFTGRKGRPPHATDAGMEDEVYGVESLRPVGEWPFRRTDMEASQAHLRVPAPAP